MSTPREIVLAGHVDDLLTRLLGALTRLPTDMPRYALIGGVAVMAQLGGVHRVTADVDTVAWSDDGTTESVVRALMASGAQHARNGVRLGDVDIDIIGVGDYDEADLDGLTELDRAFAVGQRWALDTAESVRLVVAAGNESLVAVTTRLATPAALVATKLQSLPRRRGQTITKRTSDLYDIYRLLARHNRDGGLARALATAPHGLATWCAGQAEALLVDEAERGARWLATEGSPSMARVTVEALRAVGGLLVADLADAS